MIDTTESATVIGQLISADTPERELIAILVPRFPDLTRPEFLAALQDATAAAEKQALRRH